MKEYIIQSKSGAHFSLHAGRTIKVVDLEGQQVADFFAISTMNSDEILSPGVTIDCNESISISQNDALYSNLYNQMFIILDDTVGKHDLIHPCCRPEMYDYFYQNGRNHPSCFNNINNLLKEMKLPTYNVISPFNIFMNTEIDKKGNIKVLAPLSKPNDYIILKAQMNVDIFIAACSVSESDCNGGKCTPLKVSVE